MSKYLLETREEEQKPSLFDAILRTIREWLVSLAVALVLVLIMRTFLCTVIRVEGTSMVETLQHGDRIYVSVLTARIYGYERGDVVICHYPERNENFVKRIIALPGDTVEVADGVLYINGEVTEEPYLSEERTVNFRKGWYDFGPMEIPEGEYFVMGDHRDDSNDSRSVGTISQDELVGIARCVIWPLSRLGGVQ